MPPDPGLRRGTRPFRVKSTNSGVEAPAIFILCRSLNIGGAERQLVHLALGLHERGHKVVVGLFYCGGVLDAEIRDRGIELIDLGKRGRWDVLGFLVRLRSVLRETRPAAVYSFLNTANIVAAAVRPLAPRFRLVWSIRASDMDPSRYGWLARLNYGLERVMARAADLTISNSQAGRDHAVALGFPAASIEVVPNGIDTDRFRPDPAARAAKRREWGLAEGETAIGVLARLDPMKDHESFLRAAARVAELRPEARFLCIGEGPDAYRQGLVRLAAGLGLTDRVIWTGRCTDPAAALAGLDICCSSSVFGEGFSNAIGEAMACGLPCVVTDVGDSAMIVGDTGTIVPRGQPEALAQSLLAEIGRLGEGRGERARARIVENFSVDRMVERTLSLVLPGGRPCGTDRGE